MVRVWRNWNSCAPLVGVSEAAAAVANSMAMSRRTEIELPSDSGVSLLRTRPKELKRIFVPPCV